MKHSEMSLALVNEYESSKLSCISFLGYWISDDRDEEYKLALNNYATKECTREELRDLWMLHNASVVLEPMSFENFEMIYETS